MSLRFHKTAPLITLYHNPSSPTSLRALALLRRAQRSGDPSPSESQSHPIESPGQEFLREAASSAHGLEVELEIKERAKDPPTPGQVQTILGYLKQGSEGAGSGTVETEAVLGLGLGFGLGPGKGKGKGKQAQDDHAVAAAAAPPRRTPAAAASSDPSKLSRGEMRTRVRAYQSGSSPGSSSDPPSSPSQLQPEPPAQDPESESQSQSQSQWPQLDDSSLVSRLKDSELLLVDWDSGRAVTDLAGVERLLARLREEQQERVQRESGTARGGGCVIM